MGVEAPALTEFSDEVRPLVLQEIENAGMLKPEAFDWSRAFRYLQQPYDDRIPFAFIEIDELLIIRRAGCKDLEYMKVSGGF